MDLKGDELDEALMDDDVMMAFLKEAMDTGDVEQVMKAARTIVDARDHRNVTIRELVNHFK